MHPRVALFDADEPAAPVLPVCDHYAGVEARMRKSLLLQAELGPVFDVTLDAEDGAPVGGETEHALLIAALLASGDNRFGRVGARLLPVQHPKFGEGTVLAFEGSGEHMRVHVNFSVSGAKWLVLAYARLSARQG